jgi:hypothetical protein
MSAARIYLRRGRGKRGNQRGDAGRGLQKVLPIAFCELYAYT